MEETLSFASIMLPTVIALMQLAKITFPLPKNYVPLIATILGLAVGAAAYPYTELELVVRLWAGGFAGLASTGLFEIFNPRTGVTKEMKK
ncbi:holin [Bacillus tianshenii]|nr:holin [Bacillus tianshenii]